MYADVCRCMQMYADVYIQKGVYYSPLIFTTNIARFSGSKAIFYLIS